MKKLFVTSAVVGLVLALQVPASAQTGVRATLSGVSGGQAVSGSVGLRGCASAGTGVKKIEILIDGRVVKAQEFGNLQSEGCTDYGWDTTRSGGGVAPNGGASITVRASAAGGSTDQAGASVTVDNAPQAPSGLSVTNSGGSVNVSWAANPEPDITGYKVERDSGAGWTTVGETGATSLSDSVSYGDHSYRVIAFRKSSISGTKGSASSGPTAISYPSPSTGEDGGTDGGTVGDGTAGGSGSGSSGGTGNGGSGNGSNGVPGYGTPGGSGKGKNGAPGSRGETKGGLPSSYGSSGSRSLSGIGLPGGLTLPGRGSASVPTSGEVGALAQDGTFEELLPYELPNGEGTLVNDPGNPFRPAFVNEMMIIPPDALRWVGAGLWLIVTALLLKFLERRVAAREVAEVTKLPKTEASAA